MFLTCCSVRFAAVQSFLKYTLLLLAFIGFTSSVFELDRDEYKQNFKKDEQTFNVSLKSHVSHDFKFVPTDVLPFHTYSFFFEKEIVQRKPVIHQFTDPEPPKRLYLHNSVFLI